MIPYRVGFKLRVRLTWLSPPPRLPASPPPPRLPPLCWQAIRALMGYFVVSGENIGGLLYWPSLLQQNRTRENYKPNNDQRPMYLIMIAKKNTQ